MVFREFIETEDGFSYRKRSAVAITVNAFVLCGFGTFTKDAAIAVWAVVGGTIASLVLPLVFAGPLWLVYRRFFKVFFVTYVSLNTIGWAITLYRFLCALGEG